MSNGISVEEALMALGLLGASGKHDLRGQGWSRLYVLTKRKIQIGRLSFRNGVLQSIKSYKGDYIRTIDETDRIFIGLYYYFETGKVLKTKDFLRLKKQAELLSEEDAQKRYEFREAFGSGKNKTKIVGKSQRRFLWGLVFQNEA